MVDDVVEVHAAKPGSRIAGVGDDVVEVDAASPGSRIAGVLEPGGNDAGVAWSRVTGVGDERGSDCRGSGRQNRLAGDRRFRAGICCDQPALEYAVRYLMASFARELLNHRRVGSEFEGAGAAEDFNARRIENLREMRSVWETVCEKPRPRG